jgi:hypothetical protein
VHRVLDVELAVSGGTASCATAERNNLLRAGDAVPVVVTGRYAGELVRTPGGWRIRTRRSEHR